MRNILEESFQRNYLKKSRQEMIDKTMCKPGYTWNETLQKCLPAYAGDIDDIIDTPDKPRNPEPETIEMPPMPETDIPNAKIAKEVSKRAMKRG